MRVRVDGTSQFRLHEAIASRVRGEKLSCSLSTSFIRVVVLNEHQMFRDSNAEHRGLCFLAFLNVFLSMRSTVRVV